MKKWWQTMPWSERPRGQKIGIIAGWCFLALVLASALLDSREEQPVSAAQAEMAAPPALPPQPQNQASTTHDGPTPKDAAAFIAELDSAVEASEAALRRGDLKSLHEHSKRMNQLKSDGERFGQSIYDPFGRCFGAGLNAQSWWSEQLSAAQRGGKESLPGVIATTWKEYQENRSECLKAPLAGSESANTEQIVSTSETPPRKGCLKVLGVRPDGQVGTVAYTCPKT